VVPVLTVGAACARVSSRREVSVLQASFGRALLGGLVGWVALTLVMVMAPLMGVPPMSIPSMLGGMFGVNSLVFGWIMHLMIGLVLGLVYAYRIAPHFSGAPWLRGLLYSLLPWLVLMVVIAPVLPVLNPMLAKMPPGFFFANIGFMAIMGTLIAHLVYGVVLGAIVGAPSFTRQEPLA